MSAKDGLGYSVLKIFAALFILTGVEVGWGYGMRDPRWLLWGGLVVFAFLKGLLIFMYFMHMKFERWLVWSLVLPTPLLVAVIFGYVSKDLSFNDYRDRPVGDMRNAAGEVVRMIDIVPPGAGGHGGPAAPAAGH